MELWRRAIHRQRDGTPERRKDPVTLPVEAEVGPRSLRQWSWSVRAEGPGRQSPSLMGGPGSRVPALMERALYRGVTVRRHC